MGLAEERILITGSSGLIGRALIKEMNLAEARLIGFDVRERTAAAFGDLRDHDALQRALTGITGIVHLGGVSRVIWGERRPGLCRQVNIDATRNLLALALKGRHRPWFVYASSREVYGQQCVFPVRETAKLSPMNVYARSKVAAEQCVSAARDAGLQTAIVRFSSVYGDVDDHSDRVVPAFASAAAQGGMMRIDGSGSAFDFTHVNDIAIGLMKVCSALSAGEKALPVLHFVSGVRTTLGQLAELASDLGDAPRQFRSAPARNFDISEFYGDPARAASVLDWRTTISLRTGMGNLIRAFQTRLHAGIHNALCAPTS